MEKSTKVWITLAILLTALNGYLWVSVNDLVKAENKRIYEDKQKLEYISIDRHWHEMNQKMKESAE